jgi:hypothetical protein
VIDENFISLSHSLFSTHGTKREFLFHPCDDECLYDCLSFCLDVKDFFLSSLFRKKKLLIVFNYISLFAHSLLSILVHSSNRKKKDMSSHSQHTVHPMSISKQAEGMLLRSGVQKPRINTLPPPPSYAASDVTTATAIPLYTSSASPSFKMTATYSATAAAAAAATNAITIVPGNTFGSAYAGGVAGAGAGAGGGAGGGGGGGGTPVVSKRCPYSGKYVDEKVLAKSMTKTDHEIEKLLSTPLDVKTKDQVWRKLACAGYDFFRVADNLLPAFKFSPKAPVALMSGLTWIFSQRDLDVPSERLQQYIKAIVTCPVLKSDQKRALLEIIRSAAPNETAIWMILTGLVNAPLNKNPSLEVCRNQLNVPSWNNEIEKWDNSKSMYEREKAHNKRMCDCYCSCNRCWFTDCIIANNIRRELIRPLLWQ